MQRQGVTPASTDYKSVLNFKTPNQSKVIVWFPFFPFSKEEQPCPPWAEKAARNDTELPAMLNAVLNIPELKTYG